tara:strand:+ start:10603 stop:11091 length:489 start_codon:yes stop_codon:yes gene_type:complete
MSENHKIGDMIPFGPEIYTIRDIKDGYIYMKNIKEERGQPKKMKIELTPYFVNGELLIPERKTLPKKKYSSVINISKIIREEYPDITLSRDFISLVHENIETIILNLTESAIYNAGQKNHRKLKPAHWFWLDVNKKECFGYWPSHNNYMEEKECASLKKNNG